MIELTEVEVHQVIHDVTPTVKWLTHYDLDLNNLTVHFIKEGDFFRIVETNANLEMGISLKPVGLAAHLRRTLAHSLGRSIGIGAVYSFSEQAIYFNGTKTGGLFSKRPHLTLGHELVHRGQHVMFPDYYDYRLFCSRQIYRNGWYSPDTSSPYYRQAQLLSAFIETEAYKVTKTLAKFFPDEGIGWGEATLAMISCLPALPFMLQNSMDIASWTKRNLPSQERRIVFQNPAKIIDFYQNPQQLPSEIIGE